MSTLDRVRIRRATRGDVEPLAVLAERTFRDTFGEFNTAEDLEAYVRDSFSLERLRAELDDERNTFLVALADEQAQPTGYAKLRAGKAHANVIGPDPIELHRLYVDRAALGQGLGAALMRACIEAAASAGYRTLWLGVWEHNARAIAFYGRWAFEAVGSQVFRLGSDEQTDLIMVRPVSVGHREGA